MKRVAEEHLRQWFVKKTRAPLTTRGARQVGKSILVHVRDIQNQILKIIYQKIDSDPQARDIRRPELEIELISLPRYIVEFIKG